MQDDAGLDTTAQSPDAVDGTLHFAEAYPYNEEAVELRVGFAGSSSEAVTFKNLLLSRENAQTLMKGLTLILAAPDAKTAWQQIAAGIEEDEPDWDAYEASKERMGEQV